MAIRSRDKTRPNRTHTTTTTTKRRSIGLRHQPPMSAPLSSFLPKPSVLALFLLLFLVLALFIPLYVFSNNEAVSGLDGPGSAQFHSIRVVNVFPHDPAAFSQGLVYGGNDTLFESTGLYGQSSVRKVDLQTGKVEILQKLKESDFGEGLTLFDNRLIQLTWLRKSGFIYDQKDLRKLKDFTHQMQDGWGLTTDGKVLYGSDGTSTLYKLDPYTFKAIEKLKVMYNGREVHSLNELEIVHDEVWANVWQTDCIARISPKDGVFLGWISLSSLREGLLRAGETGIDVLNGIAWDGRERTFVTGKLWPKLYEIKLLPVRKPDNGSIMELCMRKAVQF